MTGPVICKRRGPFSGSVEVPGDKSISHRALLFAALATGPSSVRNLLAAEDVLATRTAVEMLGAEVTEREGEIFIRPAEKLVEPDDVVD